MAQRILIGTAGWNIRRDSAQHFAESGTHLARYAARFQAVEINSSFYRPHRTSTYARWADSVPSEFRFSVKLPKQMTHELRLNVSAELMERISQTFVPPEQRNRRNPRTRAPPAPAITVADDVDARKLRRIMTLPSACSKSAPRSVRHRTEHR